jgi:hypothetical protein
MYKVTTHRDSLAVITDIRPVPEIPGSLALALELASLSVALRVRKRSRR